MQAQGNTGRHVPTSAESAVWTSRILKEKAAAAAVRDHSSASGGFGGRQCFSIRAAVKEADVPIKFKVSQTDPREVRRLDPTTQGPECAHLQAGDGAGPQARQPYPVTSNQDLGWLLTPPGDAAGRFRRNRKLRLGFGWPEGPPANFSEVSAAPPMNEDRGTNSSLLSAATPTELLSYCPPFVAHKGASEVSAGHASELQTFPSQPVRSSSLPIFGAAAVAGDANRLCRREKKIQHAILESKAYLNDGQRGQRWARHMISTDVTTFDNEFTKQNLGVPLYKMGR